MAKTKEPNESKQPTIEQLQAKIKQLEEFLAEERKLNRQILGLPEDAPDDQIPVEMPWSNEWMARELDLAEVTDGAVTDVYDQRVFKLLRLRSGAIHIKQHNGKEARRWTVQRPYKKLKIKLNENSFFMLLELMQFAAREFDNNRDAVIAKLTNGKGIKVRRQINGF